MKSIFSLLFAFAAIYSLLSPVDSNFITSTFHYGRPVRDRKSIKLSQKVISICGGSSMEDSSPSKTKDVDPTISQFTGNTTCLISTSLGSTFLDKVKQISIRRNATVFDLKTSIHEKFPGTPPVTLQKLFFGFRALNNTELIGNISTGNQIPILLDMITGTSSYNRTMSITQALEAYVSVVIHQTYLSGMTRKVFDNKDSLETSDATTMSLDNQEQIETLSYREMFELINQMVYTQHATEIAIALKREKEPDVITADTIAWRKNQVSSSAADGEDTEDEDGGRNPLVSAFAKQFDTNKQVALALTYYSVVLVVFSKYATSAKGSKSFLLVMVPFLWLSKLRQFRLASKVGLTLFLQVAPYIDFIMPLLPAPYQVIALESKKWKTPSRYPPATATSTDDEGEEENEEEGLSADDDDDKAEEEQENGESTNEDDEEDGGEDEDDETADGDEEEEDTEQQQEEGGDQNSDEEVDNQDEELQQNDSNEVDEEESGDNGEVNNEEEEEIDGAEEGDDTFADDNSEGIVVDGEDEDNSIDSDDNDIDNNDDSEI